MKLKLKSNRKGAGLLGVSELDTAGRSRTLLGRFRH